jgi:hypothetical protein
VGKLVLRALGWAAVGLFAAPLAVLAVMIVVYQFDSRCGTPGDSGGCEMGMAVSVISAVPIGAIVFFLFVLIRGLTRRPPAGG